ncbi:Male sterility protein [Nesidiocoris tenuis]|uniref:Fatty acyl-CoA reductase n=1 Tax=Nesidiocoris tenuis TaxID=355587 RepID=A0ABN7B364_9HEMI|nr:Male sterility protein [Nesidiocoris tenuis]
MASSIVDFYNGKSLFITGGTGLMGKVLIEKLLYACPGVDTIYFLVRPKRGKSIDLRTEEMLKMPMFSRLKKEFPERLTKLVPICGDVCTEGLGLSPEDERRLVADVDIVVHSAASLRLDAKLKEAIVMNTEGTYNVLEIAKKMKNLKLMVHMSTAFCHCDLEVMEEKVYPPPHDPMDILHMNRWMESDMMEKIAKDLIKPHPNVYTYSKRISEALVASYFPKMPVCIVRPSIVCPAAEEPLPGWVDNLHGPVGILVGAGKGVIRTMLCHAECNAEVMPVDMAISGLLAIIKSLCVDDKKTDEVPVYNLTQGKTRPVTWGTVLEEGRKCFYKNPFEIMLWYPNGDLHRSKFVHDINVILFHWLPAYFVDFLLLIFGQKTFMLKVQRKVQDGLDVLQYFTTRRWTFRNDQLLKMRSNMSPEDRKIFNIEFEDVPLIPYLTNCILGARHFILKEDPNSIPRSRILLNVLWIFHLLGRFVFYSALLWMFYIWSDSARIVLDTVIETLSNFVPFLRHISAPPLEKVQ